MCIKNPRGDFGHVAVNTIDSLLAGWLPGIAFILDAPGLALLQRYCQSIGREDRSRDEKDLE